MPAAVQSLLDILSVTSIDLASLGLPMGCLQLASFFNQLLFVVLGPCVVALLIIVCSVAAEAMGASRSRGRALLKGGMLRALPGLLTLSFFAFPMVSSLAFQAFNCEEFDDGTAFLRADYAVDCRDAEQYGPIEALALVAISLYPVGIPLMSLALLLAARKAILTERPTALSRALSFLHQDYEPKMFYWELVEIGKKLFLVGFCVLILPGTTEQLIIGFIVAFVLLLFSSIAEPYHRYSPLHPYSPSHQ